jgi:hypothetical protein
MYVEYMYRLSSIQKNSMLSSFGKTMYINKEKIISIHLKSSWLFDIKVNTASDPLGGK